MSLLLLIGGYIAILAAVTHLWGHWAALLVAGILCLVAVHEAP